MIAFKLVGEKVPEGSLAEKYTNMHKKPGDLIEPVIIRQKSSYMFAFCFWAFCFIYCFVEASLNVEQNNS